MTCFFTELPGQSSSREISSREISRREISRREISRREISRRGFFGIDKKENWVYNKRKKTKGDFDEN
jgi:hypothetical protein